MRSALLLALFALGIAGCGGGDQPVTKRPRTTTERAQPTTQTAPPQATAPSSAPQAPTRTAQDPATAPAPKGEGNGRTRGSPYGGADSPSNDMPPPKKSPADRFEQHCKRDPTACD